MSSESDFGEDAAAEAPRRDQPNGGSTESLPNDKGSRDDAHRAVLLPHHHAMIEGSAIGSDVAEERGYRSVETKAELRRLGFTDTQRRVPALLVPVYGVNGEIATYQCRPDEPRIDARGKSVKYETPSGTRMALDVPPRCHRLGWLADPHRPLFITEGARKADAAVTKGLCAIAVLGVWNFRGTNEQGGKTALADWEAIALNGRDIYICYDSDVMTKPAVHAALARLKALLESRGTRVKIIYLRPSASGAKVGLDDFFAAGGDVDALLRLATECLLVSADAERATPYATTPDGRTVYYRPTRDGDVEETLANFTAEIIADVEEDDGVETTRSFMMRALVAGRVQEFSIPVATFHGMSWPSEMLGAKAIVKSGFGSKDRLREAIQTLSADEIPTRRVYRHVGWIKRDDQHIYLHAGGGIGEHGIVDGIAVRLDSPLDRFLLPPPPEDDDARRAVRESLALLDGLAPDQVMFPLFSMIPTTLVHSSRESLHLTGKTGGKKTELAALVQRHFGASMDAEHLPASWLSTANFNETLGFSAKDAVVVIDDFNPTGAVADVQRQHRDADRIFRGHGNASGRGRLRADGTPRPAKTPRGMVLSTGEDVPVGHSLRARMLVIEIHQDDVNVDKLTQRQAAGAFYSQTTAAFVRWTAGSLDEMRKSFASESILLRSSLLRQSAHARTATIGAELLTGFALFIRFAQEIGAIDAHTAQALNARATRAIRQVLNAQGEHQEDSDPTRLFLHLIGAALRAGDAHLADRRSGRVPQSEELARAVGWRQVESTTHATETFDWRAGGPRIGWIDIESEAIYLDPVPAYRAAQKESDQSPARIGVGEKTLWKRLDEAGLLTSKDPGRHTLKVRLGKSTPNVLHVRASLILEGSGTSGTDASDAPEADENADLFSISVPDSPSARAGTGTENGNATRSDHNGVGSSVPVPDVPDSGDHRHSQEKPSRGGRRDPCRGCDGTRWWRRESGSDWYCERCTPPSSAAGNVIYSTSDRQITEGASDA